MAAVQLGKFGIRTASFIPTRKTYITQLGSLSTRHNIHNPFFIRSKCILVQPLMANVRGRTAGMLTGEKVSPMTPTRVKIVPSSGWTEDSNGHYLLVDLEGFNREKVRLEVNTTAGHLTVTGERQVNEREHVYIDENFPLPANSDVDKITGKFDGEILYVTVPKVVAVVEPKKDPEITENQKIEASPAAEFTHPRAPCVFFLRTSTLNTAVRLPIGIYKVEVPLLTIETLS